MNPLDETDDFAGILATDAWLDAIGHKATSHVALDRTAAPHDDALASALTDWLADIDRDYREPTETVAPVPLHARRFAAAVVAATLLMTAGTAVAQPSSPIHRLLFGHHSAPTAAQLAERRARTLVDQAQNIADAGRGAALRPADANHARALLSQASGLLAPLSPDPVRTGLLERIHSAAAQLAAELRLGAAASPADTADSAPSGPQETLPSAVGRSNPASTDPSAPNTGSARPSEPAETSLGAEAGRGQSQGSGTAFGGSGGDSGAAGQGGPGQHGGSSGPGDGASSSPDPQGTDGSGPPQARSGGSDGTPGGGGSESAGTGSSGGGKTGD